LIINLLKVSAVTTAPTFFLFELFQTKLTELWQFQLILPRQNGFLLEKIEGG
jgi:hypothetical protein